jgi:hypothetical protein
MIRYSVLLVIGLLVFSSCKEKESVDFGYEYFPMKAGHFVEYDVLEVFHDVNINPQHDSVRYRLKTKIGEEVLDNSGRLSRKFFQYKYDLNSGELLEQRVWTRIIDEGRGEVVEENQRKIRMVFAVKKDVEWEVNAFNTGKKENVFYSEVNKSRSLNSFEFEFTAKVDYADFFSLVDYRKMYEVYSKDVGLIRRSFKDLTIQNFDTLDVRKGTEIHYEIVNFGQE